MSYLPQQGSLPWKVIEFLTSNPDECLTAEDISAKFDTPRANIHTKMALAVEHGVLKRRTNADDELEYSLGTGTPAIKAAPGRNPTLPAASPAAAPSTVTPPRARRQIEALNIDLSAVVIEKDVPLPAGKRDQLIDWTKLFTRMQKGDSTLLPVAARATVGKAATEFKKANQGTIAIRAIGTDQIRVWRLS